MTYLGPRDFSHLSMNVLKYCCQEILIFASYEEEGKKKKEKLENGKEQRKNTYICWNVVAGDNYILVQ